MKKKFVLTLALVLMVAGTLVAATPLEVSGSFKSGYDFKFAEDDNETTAIQDHVANVTFEFAGDFWDMEIGGDLIYDEEDPITATANIYLDKALAEQGIDMGDLAVTLHVGTGVEKGAPSVLADKNGYADDYKYNNVDAFVSGIGMDKGDNFGLTVAYADLVEVYASAYPNSAFPMVIGAKVMPIDGVEAAVGFTNDYTGANYTTDGNNAMTVSAAVDIASLAALQDIALSATGELFLDLDDDKSAIVADVDAEVAGIGLWVAYYNSMDDDNYMAAEASYSTTVSDFDLSASFKTDLGIIDTSDDEIFTIAAGGAYAMGGVTYALDAEYEFDGAFTLSPSVSISF